jgi:hypothetical protein
LFDRREGCTVAGGVTESGIAGISVFLRAALDRAAKVTQAGVHGRSRKTNSRWRIFAKVEFVRYRVKYLYSPVTMGLELYLAV